MGSQHSADLAREPARQGSTAGLSPEFLGSAQAPFPAQGPGNSGALKRDGGSSAVAESKAPAGGPIEATVISQRPPALPASDSRASLSDLASELIGRDLDHFQITEYLGGGGMGAVFRGVDTRLKRPVAIKVLRRNVGRDEESLRRFLNEAQSAARLDHEHIARVYFCGQDRDLHYIAFELIEGQNLRDLVLERGPLPIPQAVRYTLQVAGALAHASARDVVHRDIKPSNLLITPGGQCKLVDMGLSRLQDAEQANGDLTASGVTLGTFDYISPEQALDPRIADVRSDIYSLGCTLYFMLTGRPPFPEGNPFQKLLRHKGDDPADPRQFNPAVPEDLVAILRRMIAKEPSQRFATADDLVAELHQLARQMGIATSNSWSRVEPAGTSRWRRLEQHLPWGVPLAILLAIVVAMEWASPPPTPSADLPSPNAGAAVEPRTVAAQEVPGSTRSLQPAATTAGGATPKKVSQPPAAGGNAPLVPTTTVADPAPDPRQNIGDTAAELTLGATGAGVTQGETARVAVDATADGSAASAAPRAEGTPPSAVPPIPAASQTRVLTVGEGGYPSLEKALEQAHSRDTIELRYNGRMGSPLPPLRLGRKDLTIQAAGPFRPVLTFVPDESEDAASAMFTVSDGELILRGLAIEMDFPCQKPQDGVDWALFRSRQALGVRLERCSLTIRNSTDPESAHFHPQVAFFDLEAEGSEPQRRKPQLTLVDCVVRGEADLLRSRQALPCRLEVRNSLVTTSKRALVATGAAAAPLEGATLELSFHGVTARLRGGFAAFSGVAAGQRRQLPAEVLSVDSIFVVDRESPFIEQLGGDAIDRGRERFVWVDRRNFYEGVETFWHIANLRDLGELADDFRLDFAAWREKWAEEGGEESFLNRVQWRSPLPAGPAHRHQPQQFALLPDAGNPALERGAMLERLPHVPEDPAMLPEPRSKPPGDGAGEPAGK